MRRYAIGIIGIVLIAVLAIFLLTRHGSNTTNKTPGKQTVNLTKYIDKTGSEVRWTMQGAMVGEDQRRSVRVVVTPNERRLEILDGYEEAVESTKTFNNTYEAYDAFLRALDLAGFTKEHKTAVTDERGVCPLGNRFVYDLADGSDHPLHLWSSTCGFNVGTSAGNAALISQLFRNQVTDYNKLVQNVKLSY